MVYKVQNIFSFTKEPYKITKPIRLIELFGGVGCQAKALEKMNVNFEHYKLVEFDKKCVASYNAIHNTNFKPLDITKIHAADLNICDTYLLTYLLTYSFPCQDLSLAGKKKGMAKGDNTRSGLLWEVERILNECEELPQILIMENVPQVHSQENVKDFNNWQLFLEKKGYTNYWQDLNAKDYGIPQNRNRCFMVSILGDYYYEFPQPIPLKLKLKDMLEKEVDENYYLSDKQIDDILHWNAYEKPFDNMEIMEKTGVAKTLTTRSGAYAAGMLLVKNATEKGYLLAEEGNGVDISGRMQYHCGTVQKDMAQTITTSQNNGVVVNNLRIRKLTPRECWRLMGFEDSDFDKVNFQSDATLYKQAGNGIVVKVLENIFKQLF